MKTFHQSTAKATVQYDSVQDNQEVVQCKGFPARTSFPAPNSVKEKEDELPVNLKNAIEQSSGFSMDDVSVHYNSDKPVRLNALAYAQGTDIHLAPGQEKHLAHEAWHVVQQKQGRVEGTEQHESGAVINTCSHLEREADIKGRKAVVNGSLPVQRKLVNSNPDSTVIQRVRDKDDNELLVDVGKLKKKDAKRMLTQVASQKVKATPEEMKILMDKVNPERLKSSHRKGITDVKKSTFESRITGFYDNLGTFSHTDFVVPDNAEHLEKIKDKQKEIKKSTGTELTESQAWALVLAELRGNYNKAKLEEKALQRLESFNENYNTNYTKEDLPIILNHLQKGTSLATNYTFSKPPGANTGSDVSTSTLAALLMQDTQFKQVWETGASQASTDYERRGAVEESMGYGSALRRVGGSPLRQINATGQKGKFAPVEDPVYGIKEMPKYAALVSKYQTHGVAPRYGPSVVYWKDSLKERATHTPGDSWSMTMEGALTSYTSSNRPEAIFSHSDESIMRLAAAEATGKDKKFLEQVKSTKGLSTDAYIETQIHGSLGWEDVEEIVIGEEEKDAEKLKKQFEDFRDKNNFTFKVSTKKAAKSEKADDKKVII